MRKTNGLDRRELLFFGAGAAALTTVPGCALISGGAEHQTLDLAKATLEGDTLTIPLAELKGVDDGGVLSVQPGPEFSDLLIRKAEGDVPYAIVTALCPHAGCVVDQAPSGSGWQCPCHGSKFAAKGALEGGPATTGLQSPSASIESSALVIDLSSVREA